MAKDKDPNHYYSRGLFFKNYDLYDTEGVDGPAKQGPGTGLHSGKYKSVTEFLNKKRKQRIKKRKKAFTELKFRVKYSIDVNSLDFPSDSMDLVITYGPSESSSIGLMDGTIPQLEDDKGQTVGTPGYGMDDDLGPVPFNPFGVADGNNKPIDVNPEETKNLYYGILNTKNQ